MPTIVQSKNAVLLIDVQNDFIAMEGAMRIPGASKIVPKCRGWYNMATMSGWPCFVSQDWHPANHCSFVPNGGNLPIHCIQGWKGAGLHGGLYVTPSSVFTIKKGMDASKDPRSALEGTVEDLGEDLPSDPLLLLKHMGVRNIFVGGLPAEYGVKETVKDLLGAEFQVFVVGEAVAGMHPQGYADSMNELAGLGAVII